MKKILVSMRECIGTHGEQWDVLDVRWIEFLHAAGLLPILMPNNVEHVKSLLANIPISGVLLTGSGEVPKNVDDFSTRDAAERMVIEYAINHKVPIRGVCRGMQHLAQYYGAVLTGCEGQIAAQQSIIFEGEMRKVNSYHNFSLTNLPECFEITGTSQDKLIIKAIAHKELNIAGIMWHPERMKPFSDNDKALFQRWYQ